MKMIKNKIAYVRPLVSSLPKVMTVPCCASAVAAAACVAGAAASVASRSKGSTLLSDSSVRLRGVGHKGSVELSV